VQVLFDGGVPDGLGLGVSIAPVPHLRLSASGVTNLIGIGARGGIALVPFTSWPVHPILALDAGRFFNGDPRPLLPEGPSSFRYDFVDATLGLEVMFRVVVLRAGGGIARVWATMPDATLNGSMPAAKIALALKLN
jgi:hypothetical protein